MLDSYQIPGTVWLWREIIPVPRRPRSTACIRHCPRTAGQDMSYCGSTQTFTSPPYSFKCLMRTSPARFLSDTTRCPMVTLRSVCHKTVPYSGSGPIATDQIRHGRIAGSGRNGRVLSILDEGSGGWEFESWSGSNSTQPPPLDPSPRNSHEKWTDF